MKLGTVAKEVTLCDDS